MHRTKKARISERIDFGEQRELQHLFEMTFNILFCVSDVEKQEEEMDKV